MMTKYDVGRSSTSSAGKGLRAIRKEPPCYRQSTSLLSHRRSNYFLQQQHPSNNHGRHHPFSSLRRQACCCHTSICQARSAIKLPLYRIESRWQGELSTLVFLAVSIAPLSDLCCASSTLHPIDKAKCLSTRTCILHLHTFTRELNNTMKNL